MFHIKEIKIGEKRINNKIIDLSHFSFVRERESLISKVNPVQE